MTQHTRIFSSFEFYAEDIDCEFCEHTMRKSKKFKNGCREEICRYEDIRREAIDNGRIKREEGELHNETDSNNMEGGANS